jgi:hypothetical protein
MENNNDDGFLEIDDDEEDEDIDLMEEHKGKKSNTTI